MNAPRNKPAVSMAEIRPELERLRRRGFLRNVLSLGALTMLTGCDLSTHSGVDAALEATLRFDDRVQAALFSRQRLAETYPASAITLRRSRSPTSIPPATGRTRAMTGSLAFDRAAGVIAGTHGRNPRRLLAHMNVSTLVRRTA
jgi:hypothetical protein